MIPRRIQFWREDLLSACALVTYNHSFVSGVHSQRMHHRMAHCALDGMLVELIGATAIEADYATIGNLIHGIRDTQFSDAIVADDEARMARLLGTINGTLTLIPQVQNYYAQDPRWIEFRREGESRVHLAIVDIHDQRPEIVFSWEELTWAIVQCFPNGSITGLANLWEILAVTGWVFVQTLLADAKKALLPPEVGAW